MNDFERKIATNLVYYRKRAGLKQKELAELLGTKSASVSNWENQYNSMDIETLYRICELLGIHIDDICGRPSHTGASPLTEHERALLVAYQSQPAMQKAVDRLLGLDLTEDATQDVPQDAPAPIVKKVKASEVRRVFRAAYETDPKKQ